MKPDIRIVAMDETEFWTSQTLVDKMGKQASAYIFDANLQTYLCSLTPSYWLQHITFDTLNRLDDKDYDEVQKNVNGLDEPSMYYDKSVLNMEYEPVTEWNDEFPGYEDKEAYDEWFNDIVEHLICNTAEIDIATLAGWEVNE